MRKAISQILMYSAMAGLAMMVACQSPTGNREQKLFTSVDSNWSGIEFGNYISESDSINLIQNEYTYMGAGVGVIDIDNDGLYDLILGSNQQGSKLYRNKGDLKFEDITESAGINTAGKWCTGISIADVNADGYDDIYICVSGKGPASRLENLLYINKQNNTFSEQGKLYGLADTSYSTQAVWLDYDKDGDLDVYLATHAMYQPHANIIEQKQTPQRQLSYDKMYQNQYAPQTGRPFFVEVSAKAGIDANGYTLGIAASDVNGDNWPDIYAGNDYVGNDQLWINHKAGKFENTADTSLRYQSYSTMGVDVADLSNDGLPDVVSLDMMPEFNERKKLMYSFQNNTRFELELRAGYAPQFMRNMLHINEGNLQAVPSNIPVFSEQSQWAGIDRTDWSWSVLMADFNNDGHKDLHITNGMGRDMLHADFVQFRSGNNDLATVRSHLDALGSVRLPNYLYLANKGEGFLNASTQLPDSSMALSNGCAYADFDNDGDLDMVINNINSKAMLLQNHSRSKATANTSNTHFLQIKLIGNKQNRNGVGAKIVCYQKGKQQWLEQYPVRGYLSSVAQILHFGLESHSAIDSLKVIWPNDSIQTLIQPAVDTLLTLYQTNAKRPYVKDDMVIPLWTNVSSSFSFTHRETFFNDFSFQPLFWQKYSQQGPCLAKADINHDGLEDFFIGGAYQQSGCLFMQMPNGTWAKQPLDHLPKEAEDVAAIFADTDGDGDQDLVVASGGFEYDEGSVNYTPRLYINNGKGKFTRLPNAFEPSVNTSAGCLAASDVDGDGDTDLFMGGRIAVGSFPLAPRSYLLQNNGGYFSDATQAICPALAHAGMITSAVFVQWRKNRLADLVIAGEAMTPLLFANEQGKLVLQSKAFAAETAGLWNCLYPIDVDNDKDLDIVAGNIGSNNPFHIGVNTPFKIVAKDFDNNGRLDPIFSYYNREPNGSYKQFTLASRDQLALQLPSIKRDYLLHADFAKRGWDEIFSAEATANAVVLGCTEARSGVFVNNGNGNFQFQPFGKEAQLSPVYAIAAADVNKDGTLELLLAGNNRQIAPEIGQLAAYWGVMLAKNAAGKYVPMPTRQSGFMLTGDVRGLTTINAKAGPLLLAANNNGPLQVLNFATFRANR